MNENNSRIAMRVSKVTIAANMVLSVLKFFAGIAAHSTAMISDAVHSASDVFSTFIVIVGFKLSGKKPDKEHPYGHERMECVASIVLAVVLLITGLGIGASGIKTIFFSDRTDIEIPGLIALIAALLSIVVKEWMYHYTVRAAKKINSGSLKADAWHHRSDALSSVGALIGIAGARLGFPILEPIASCVICLFIIKAAVEVFMDAVDKMVDKACDDETTTAMSEIILRQEGVKSLTELQTRMFGSKIYVDAVISVDGSIPLTQAHGIAEKVHNSIEGAFPLVKHCMVHVDPC
ncbi:MAG: cation diffusion facilitator family transporter [Lachnospiraceae bacterium]|nr:cation diffusion facilitator family transporter [Lachnospiraceae bacterium]